MCNEEPLSKEMFELGSKQNLSLFTTKALQLVSTATKSSEEKTKPHKQS